MRLGRSRPRALVGSAAKVTGSKETQYAKRLQQPWQDRALSYYDMIGELNYCSRFYARMLARCDFFAGRRKTDQEIERLQPDSPAGKLLARIQDPGGGRKRMQYAYGRLMFITGEGYLTVIDEGDDEKWKFLWRDEIELAEGGATYLKSPVDGVTDTKVTAYRMWTPSPRWSPLADSPLRAVLDIAEELVLLTAAVRSTAVSRVLNGILAIPTEVSPLGDDDENIDEDAKRSPFMTELTEHIVAQIENPGSAEAMVPFILEGGYDYLDRIKWTETHNTATDYMEKDMREEAITRLANSLDLPPEALKGLADSNHWSAQQVKWDMWQSHGVAIADQFAQDLNEAYLRPALKDADLPWEDIVVGYDDSQVVTSPDQTSVADEAWDRAEISSDGYRELKGIPARMKPTDEERKFVFAIKTRDAVVAGYEKEAPAVRGQSAEPGQGTNGKALTPAKPTGGRTVSRQESVRASIVGAAQLALRQCRSKAGARLRTAVTSPSKDIERCSECEQTIDSLPNAIVAASLGLETLELMSQRDPLAMVRGGTDDFRGILEEWGIDGQNTAVLCERIETHAASTLFDMNTPELPPGFSAHVDHALEVRDHAVVDRTA